MRSRTTSVWLLLVTTASCGVLANVSPRPPWREQRKNAAPWNLPPSSSSARGRSNSFLQECQSLALFLEELRGGNSDSWGDGSSPYYDDRSRPPSYRGDDRFSEDRYHEDQFRHDTYRDEGFPSGDRYDQRDRGGSYDTGDAYYDDRGSPSRRENGSSPFSALPSFMKTGDKKIGSILVGAGAVISMLGFSLFFNKTLMRLGNLLLVAGVATTLGVQRTAGYFLQPQKARATGCLLLGMFLVFIGWPVFGIALEVFGLLNLFGNMFPVILAVAKQTPFLGNLLKGGGNNNNQKRNERRDDPYYYDEEPRRSDDYRDDDPYY